MSDAYAALAEVLDRLGELTGRPGRLPEALDVAGLSYRTGIPVGTVVELLSGGRAAETCLAQRVRQRLDFIRETRRRPDGKRYSLDELARIAGTSRQWLSEWRKSGMPSLEHADRLRRFFGLPAGFFTADEPEALHEALQPVVQSLEAEADPLLRLRESGLIRLAARAPQMNARQLATLADLAEMIIASERAGDAGRA
ncbi:helix-turn-helix transcriptional regulator [Streptomyces sp. 5-8]|uniref:Helix-turn-helix transcriptional regulator n=1 Tax=Streptomyces musisoli TaxID=2802280 RepID=A0ABS1NX41_9ACTN|nr:MULTISPECIES: helix-turn-helix transcriptional regulator [Streptomyces]MBL1104682.1 helix-turn-helix transcriptional regulator [Streptomyces musisoli]MBY8846151.1 helix-turn-helix domain-containing protein [Streptomyces sp. SP2-10]